MAEEFKVLTDRDHCLLRPSMYVGSTTSEDVTGIINFKHQTKRVVPGLLKIIFEIVDNSIDEFIRTNGEHANKISVDVDFNGLEGSRVIITDNGRGIPVEKIGDSYRPVLAWTSLRAGTNFSNDRVSIGANGVGSSLTNIFSKSFIGKTSDGKNQIVVRCSDNMSTIDYSISPSKLRGTSVEIIPDLDRFGVSEIDQDHLDMIKDRLSNVAIVYPGIVFKFNGETIKFKSIKEVAESFCTDFVVSSTDNVHLVFAPTGVDEEFRCLSYVNGLNIKNGGSHVDFVMNKIVETLRASIKKKHKLDVVPNQIKQHLMFASWISGFNNLKFDSQTKERVTNTQGEVSVVFTGVDFEKIAKKILDVPAIIDPIISALLRKKEAQEAAELEKKNKEIDKGNLRKIVKFTDASEQKNRHECMLMICEGDSANSSILSARTSLVGSYPLRGKPINVMAATTSELMANKEFSDLLKITGLKIGVPVKSVSDLRFGKIVITTDADLDGNGITGLQIAMYRRFWPEMFSLGMIYRFRTPIMKVIQDKKETYFDTLTEFEAWAEKEKKPFKTRYLKGLGSSTTADFKRYFSEIESRLEQITIGSTADFEVVDMVYSKEKGAADKRKEWLVKK